MDPGLRTPLLDFFRRGEAAADVRLLAARGALAPRALEQLALLVLLSDDPDGTVRAAAGTTLDRLPGDLLAAFLARSEVPDPIRTFFRERGIEPSDVPGPDQTEPLFEAEDAEADETASTPSALGVLARLKLATRGTREQRAVLIRDPHRMVAVAVLSSPKLTDSEVESFARMTTVAEEILRIIGQNRSWTKNYTIVASLVRNPKTPPAIAMSFVSRLNDRDLRLLVTDRNVPDPVRIVARKFAASGESRRR